MDDSPADGIAAFRAWRDTLATAPTTEKPTKGSRGRRPSARKIEVAHVGGRRALAARALRHADEAWKGVSPHVIPLLAQHLDPQLQVVAEGLEGAPMSEEARGLGMAPPLPAEVLDSLFSADERLMLLTGGAR